MPNRYSDFWIVQFLCCLYISVIVCFVMMSGFGAKFVLLLSLHNNSEAARCPDYWSISLRRHWRDSPGLPAQTGDEGYHVRILLEKYCKGDIEIAHVLLYMYASDWFRLSAYKYILASQYRNQDSLISVETWAKLRSMFRGALIFRHRVRQSLSRGNQIVTSIRELSRCTQDCQRHDTTFSEIHGGNKIVKEFDNLFNLYLDGYKVWQHSRHS